MSEFLVALVAANLSASALIILTLALRGPVRRAFGSAVAYGLWSLPLVAATATLLPIAPPAAPAAISALNWSISGSAVALQPGNTAPTGAVGLIFAIWLTGVGAFASVLASKQIMFLRLAAAGRAGPAVVGLWRTRLVVPEDFSARFTADERRMILAHERAHLTRRDPIAINIVALIQCICWFNPLVHIASHFIRQDQEYACDESVVAAPGNSPRSYAELLVKAQIAHHAPPLGCYWPTRSAHTLEKRVIMLERKPIKLKARLAGCALIISVALGGGYASWAMDAQRERPTSASAADLTFRVVNEGGTSGQRAHGPGGEILWLQPETKVVGNVVAGAEASKGQNGVPVVNLVLTPEATRTFAMLTRDNIGKRIAVLVDGQVVSAPLVREEISGGRIQISGAFNDAQAQELASRFTKAAR